MILQYQYYRTDCVLRTLYIWGDPLARTRKIEGDWAQLPPADRAADLGPGGGGRRRREDKVNRFNADLFHLIVVWLLLSCRRKINLFIGQQCRGLLIKENIMDLGWITYKNFRVSLGNVPVRTIEAIIKDLPEDHEGRKELQDQLRDAYRDLKKQLEYQIEN